MSTKPDETDSEEVREAIEHRDTLLAIRSILGTASGKAFIKYLFKHFQVGELPEIGLDGVMLADTLGFLRAGNAIFKIVAEADADMAGKFLAENEKEKYDRLRERN